MNIKLIKTDKNNPDFISLTKLLDKELYSIHGEGQKQYDKYNTLDKISDAVIIYDDTLPVACGGLRKFNEDTVEIKRMFVLPSYRGKKLSKIIMSELEKIALDEDYKYAVLVTGQKLIAAVNLYTKLGYIEIENCFLGGECGLWMKKELKIK